MSVRRLCLFGCAGRGGVLHTLCRCGVGALLAVVKVVGATCRLKLWSRCVPSLFLWALASTHYQ